MSARSMAIEQQKSVYAAAAAAKRIGVCQSDSLLISASITNLGLFFTAIFNTYAILSKRLA